MNDPSRRDTVLPKKPEKFYGCFGATYTGVYPGTSVKIILPRVGRLREHIHTGRYSWREMVFCVPVIYMLEKQIDTHVDNTQQITFFSLFINIFMYSYV